MGRGTPTVFGEEASQVEIYVDDGSGELAPVTEETGGALLPVKVVSGAITAAVTGELEVKNDSGSPIPTEPKVYAAPNTGEFAPGTTAGGTQFPDVAGRYVRLKARYANVGKVYVGIQGDTVTKLDGTTDAASGFELAAGDDTGWIPIDNLNRLKGIGDNATDSVGYIVIA